MRCARCLCIYPCSSLMNSGGGTHRGVFEAQRCWQVCITTSHARGGLDLRSLSQLKWRYPKNCMQSEIEPCLVVVVVVNKATHHIGQGQLCAPTQSSTSGVGCSPKPPYLLVMPVILQTVSERFHDDHLWIQG